MNSSSFLNANDVKDFMGSEGFVWFYGVVEDRKDPLFLGRVKARCIGFHTDDKTLIPTEDLPWADIIQPVTSAAISGIGTTPTGLVEGTHVFGFFRDGHEAQEPVILGTTGGIPENISNPDRGFNDSRTIAERKNSPYPPLAIDRFNNGKPARVIEHSQAFEPTTYEFVGETPLKGGKIWFGTDQANVSHPYPENFDDDHPSAKIQASVYKRPETAGPDVEPEKANNTPLLSSQIFSRNPEENRMIFDGNGIPIMSLPSTTLLGLNRTKLKESFDRPKSSTHPQSQILLKAHRIAGVLNATQQNLHKGIQMAGHDGKYGGEWSTPPNGFNPEYPYNHVTYTESGHLIELDDTPGGERVRLLHRTQRFLEFLPDGSRIDNIVGKSYFLADADVHSHIYGDEIKHVSGAMNHVYNSRSAGPNNIFFAGDGDVNTSVKKGNYNIILKDGEMNIVAKNFRIIGTKKNESEFQIQKMIAEVGDSGKPLKQVAEEMGFDTGDFEVVSSSLGLSSTGSSKSTVGQDMEVSVLGSSTEHVDSIWGGGMKKTCRYRAVTIESQNPLRGTGGVILRSGLELIHASQLTVDGSGLEFETKLGDVTVDATVGKIELTAGTNFSLETNTEIDLKNKKGNIKIDTTGNITLKGMGSDVHTLLKKLSMALQNMTHPTPAGPSGVATNMSEIMQFDAEIDKVFQP